MRSIVEMLVFAEARKFDAHDKDKCKTVDVKKFERILRIFASRASVIFCLLQSMYCRWLASNMDRRARYQI